MECEGETAAECYTKFFSLINEELGKVVAGRVFCPIARFMADEAGGLQEGLRRVYGNSVLEELKMSESFPCSAQTDNELVCIGRNRRLFARFTRALFKRKPRVFLMMLFNR